MKKTKLIIVGGFLGAGKTTLLAAASELLTQNGQKVGVITNDQAEGLVDTHTLSENGMEVQEIAGSCFCCDFDGLMEAALYLREVRRCDTIIAEPVGSCTDLSATLMQPIKAWYQQHFVLNPLSVLVDPHRLVKTLESEEQTREGSGYIYLKQLEEADHLVVNKTDVLDEKERGQLGKLLSARFEDYPVHWISALQKDGIENWLSGLSSDKKVGHRITEVDYDIYAEGEALMGWYNATFHIRHDRDLLVPLKEFNVRFLQLMQQVFEREGIATGHMKTFLKSGPSHINCNLTDTNGDINVIGPSFSGSSASLVLNIRAEASPVLLKEIVEDVIAVYEENEIIFEIIEIKNLSPGRPTPTHRMELVQ